MSVVYRCNSCGKEISEEEYQKWIDAGNAYCLCGFSKMDKHTGELLFPRILNEMKRIEVIEIES